MGSKIEKVHARQILDSRGRPTVEAEVWSGTHCGTASVPSGASTGGYEALELRDKDPSKYNGLSVEKAVKGIKNDIRDSIIHKDILDQTLIDKLIKEADGTEDKSRLGANATLAVSLAAAKCAASVSGVSFYRYIGGCDKVEFPVPMLNIINGGKHSDNNLDIQEFMLIPKQDHFPEMLRRSVEVYYALQNKLKANHLSTSVGDEGGFAPRLPGDNYALDYICAAIEDAGYKPGTDFNIGLDIAANEFKNAAINTGNDGYYMEKSNRRFSVTELLSYYSALISQYPIISIEDPFAEDDWDGWCTFTSHNNMLTVVGDDLFVTNTKRLKQGIELKAANAILIKPNQIGTLTETLETINTAKRAGFKVILSHRSGETEDTSIADIAVAVGADRIKTGAPARSERTAKYNRLLRIFDNENQA